MYSQPSTLSNQCAGAILHATVRRAVAMPLSNGSIPEMLTFDGLADGRNDHFALRFAAVDPALPTMVRVHSSCATGDILGSERCDCGPQLRETLDLMGHQGGILVYLQQEGRGIGLAHKIDAYAKQDEGLDTFAANRALGFRDDERDYLVAAQILRVLLSDRKFRLLTNNPDKARALARFGVPPLDSVPTGTFTSPANRRYLKAKRDAGHRISLGLGTTSKLIEV